AELEHAGAGLDRQGADHRGDAWIEDVTEEQVVEVGELVVQPALVRLCVCECHAPPYVVSGAPGTPACPSGRPPLTAGSCRRGSSQLPFEGGGVALAEPPLGLCFQAVTSRRAQRGDFRPSR